jgi:hypothetical protein
VRDSLQLPAGEYAFMEWFCDDLNCDCRRVLLEVIVRGQPGKSAAHIAFGWEPRAFYEKWSVAPREFAREMARQTTEAALDPGTAQSPLAPHLLETFREMIASDPDYVARLKRHYNLFRKTLKVRSSHETQPRQNR